MSEEFREDIDDLEDKINNNMNRIIDLEEKEMKMESYKIFLYPLSCKQKQLKRY